MEINNFTDALYYVLWDMEVDIFTEGEKTCALVADIVPKCRKELKRLKAMYACDAINLIEYAVASPKNSQKYLQRAVNSLVDKMNMPEGIAIETVNCVVSLWENVSPLGSADDDFTEKKLDDNGGDDMLFINTDDEHNIQTDNEDFDESEDNEPRESLISKLALSWCCGDFEDGRPLMFACPMGWLILIFTAVLGVFMVADIPYGDKLAVPVFAVMFMTLTAKRLYEYGSVAIYSIMIAAFYVAAAVRGLLCGVDNMSYLCIPVVLVALIVFNNGRFSSLLDESKFKAAPAYLIITIISAVVAAGAFALKAVSLGL